MAIAIRDSVTVSIAAETIGIFRRMNPVSHELVSVSDGITSL
jgi:hypothetical protein